MKKTENTKETVNSEETDVNITINIGKNELNGANISTSSKINFQFYCTNQVSYYDPTCLQ